MFVMVTGAKGQLGGEIVRTLEQHHVRVLPVDREDFDLTDADAVMRAVTAAKPEIIIHCGSYTMLDAAETEPEVCCQVNAMGTMNIVRAALTVDARLMYFSTGYVFEGSGEEPYEINDHRGAPRSVYGQSKKQGEEAVRSLMTRYWIIRTSWVFGGTGDNFVRFVLGKARERREFSMVDDQIGSPTYTRDLAELVLAMIRTTKYGIYHATNEGFCSRAEFARAIIDLAGIRCRVRPVQTKLYLTKAKRPLNTRLSKASLDAAGFMRLPSWKDAVSRYLDELRSMDLL